MSAFTKEVSGESAVTAADELLRSASPAIASLAALTLSTSTGYAGLGATDTAVQWQEWLASPEVELLSVADVTGHEIEGDVWYTANAKWLLYGLAVDGDGSEDGQYISCVWEAKVLFSTQDEGAASLLSQEAPAIRDTADTACVKALQRLQERVASAARQSLQTAVAAQQAVGAVTTKYGHSLYSSFAQRAAANLARSGALSFADQAAANLARSGIFSLGEQIAKSGVLTLGEQAAAGIAGSGVSSLADQTAASIARSGAFSMGISEDDTQRENPNEVDHDGEDNAQDT